MDELDQQIQTLIQEAPDDGVTGKAVEAIAPVLKETASRLKHKIYYVLQTLNQGWVMTSLASRRQPDVRKTVIYAFPTLKDAAAWPQSAKNPQLMGIPTPVTHILFQMLALKTLDSLIFFEAPGKSTQGTEIRRKDFQALMQLHLKEAQGYQDPYANIG
ncbi:MAG: TDP-N-acetylfucosamine:lipid II N-acetylfucosaminyltransferase [Leptolyngbya sp. SIO1D8]|nr:TDP-N-acetylfucosamine:lipid II N-acetylfucosaminyltransferase [Leptolyngbya sp. SIO1D8]